MEIKLKTSKIILLIPYLCLLLCFIKHEKTLCTKASELPADITTKVLDRATGKLYFGLDEGAEEAVVAFKRYNGYGNPTWNQVVPASDSLINGETIEFLALATQRCETNPIVAVVTMADDEPETQKQVLAYTSDFDAFKTDSRKASSGNLKDANQQITSGIINIAASNDYIFALVKPEDVDSEFGDDGSGVAAVKITNNIPNNGSLTLRQTDAIAGSATIQRAKPVDPSIAEIKIVTDPLFTASPPSAVVNWDEHLQRLYIGIDQVTTATTESDGARSVIVARVNANESLSFSKIAPDSAFELGDETQIVGVRIDENNVTGLTIGVHNLRVMHTSTGKSYLIVNGGNSVLVDAQIEVPGNRIFALPLVDHASTPTTHGTLARYEITNNGPFTTQATVPSDLLTSDDDQANVGTGPLALQPEDRISDIVVVGDAVFVSTDATQTTNHEPGIFYSQAMFDEDGSIYQWTPWTKRAFPFYEATDGQVKFFDIDAANGKIWAVDGVETSSVIVTAWNRRADSQTPTTLIGKLNEDFPEGSFAYLDLDQSTRGLGEASPARYALFGGLEKVAFVKTSTSFATNTDPAFDYNSDDVPFAQYVTQDFSLAQNYRLTLLPPKSGCVKVLAYSRRTKIEGKQNYFFAGTQAGLYAFSNRNQGSKNEGFVVDDTVNDLNAYPFTQSSWKKIPSISGSIVDMISSGSALYILTFETTKRKPIKNVLYKVNFEDTTTLMFANAKIIAQNSTFATDSDLSQAKMFFAMQITTTGVGMTEELLLATNNGIYRSNSSTGIFNANDQTDARWAPINENDTSVYTNLFAPDNLRTGTSSNYSGQASSTVWPVQVADENNCLTFEKTNIRQLSGSFSGEMPKFDPRRFNARVFDCIWANENFETLDPISYFWTDGARRFFIIKRVYDPAWTNKLFVIPYDIQEWMVTDPKNQVLTDPELKQAQTFYWLGPIGATGIILAGTNNGVVALQ
ncbi:hypothetical protein ACFLYU_00715 [Candidatus Dependentiae bacterium]